MLNPREDFGILAELVLVAVQFGELVEEVTAQRTVEARRIAEVQNGVKAGAETNTLVAGGQEAAAPDAIRERLVTILGARRGHDDVSRKVFVLAA